MRISDWSSDVCSSDLAADVAAQGEAELHQGIALEVGVVAGQQRDEVAQRALLEGDLPVHVGLAEVQRRVPPPLPFEAAGVQPLGAAAPHPLTLVCDSASGIEAAARSEERRLGPACCSSFVSSWTH